MKLIIIVTLFIVLICAGYSATTVNSLSINNKKVSVSQKEYKGQFLIPVENFKVVTSKYGERIHPITR